MRRHSLNGGFILNIKKELSGSFCNVVIWCYAPAIIQRFSVNFEISSGSISAKVRAGIVIVTGVLFIPNLLKNSSHDSIETK